MTSLSTWIERNSLYSTLMPVPLHHDKPAIQRRYDIDGSIDHGPGNNIDALSYGVWLSDFVLGGVVTTGLPIAIRIALFGETVISGNLLPQQYDHETRSDYPVIIKHGYKLADAITTIFTLGF